MPRVVWPELCGVFNGTRESIFWDDELTLNTSNPNLTPCFQQTVLVWVPCGLLWLLLPLYTCYLRNLTVPRARKWSKIYVFKQVCNIALCLLTAVKLTKDIINGTSQRIVSVATYQADVVELSTYMFCFIFVRWEFRQGVSGSGVFFVFWFAQAVAGVPALKWHIDMTAEHVTHSQNSDLFESLVFYVKYALTVIQFVCELFNDTPSQQEENISDDQTPLLSDFEEVEDSRYETRKREPCGEAKASFLAKITNWWICSLFVQGYKKPITFDDLQDILPDDKCKSIIPIYLNHFDKDGIQRLSRSKHGNKSEDHHHERGNGQHGSRGLDTREDAANTNTSTLTGFALFVLLLRVGFIPLVISATARLLLTVTTFLNPQLLGLVIEFVSSDDPFVWKGYFLAVVLVLNSILTSIMMQLQFKYSHVLAMRSRTCITAAVYRKALKLSSYARRQATVGEIVNLISVDTQKIRTAFINMHETWGLLVSIVLAMYFLWQEIGPSSLAGLGVLCFIAPFNGIYIAKRNATLQKAQMKQKDTRIKLISQILKGIKVLKLYAWEESFAAQVGEVRSAEMEILKKQQRLRTMADVSLPATPYIIALAIFTTYVLQPGNILDPTKAFVSLNLINTLNYSMSYVPIIIVAVSQAYISVKRISKFLSNEEIDFGNVTHDPSFEPAIMIKDGTFTWGGDFPDCLKDVNISIKHGHLVAVVGQVGCGKTSLISAILGETEKRNGVINVKGSTAYVSQQAWIQNNTLKQNVLFGQKLTETKYNDVIEACALTPDLKNLPAGDVTEIGEKGINLSGGQKLRVSLARAVYQDKDIYLMDDPLSAVDAHVGKHIFEHVIGPHGLLRHKTRVIATHGIRYLPHMDYIITIKNGKISEMGTHDELISHNGDYAEFIQTYQTEHSGKAEDDQGGTMDYMGQRSYPSSGRGKGGGQLCQENSEFAKSATPDDTAKSPKEKHKLIQEESAKVGVIKLSVIKEYVQSAGTAHAFLTCVFFIFYAGSVIGSNIWLSVWSDDSARNITVAQELTGLRLGVYAGFGGVLVLSIIGVTLSVVYGGIRASRIIHQRLLDRILRVPMSFFDTTPSGRITNRFSTDMDKIDDVIPQYICTWLAMLAPVISMFVVISYSTPIFLIAMLPLLVIYVVIQRVYAVTARQLKRIDFIRRSPIYIHLDETLNGLSCIRAFGQEQRFIEKNERLVDDSQITWYPILVAQRWLGFNLNFFGVIILLLATILAILQRDFITGGLAGLSIQYASQSNFAFNALVRTSTDLETNIVSMERLKEYSEIRKEAPWVVEGNRPQDAWPQVGRIQFKDYSTRYRPGLELVLRKINFEVAGGEKVGIVGRTGAGKSSMMSSLFRLIESAEGVICIDNQDISKIGLHDLRGKLTIIPQDPVLFSGSIRMNVDPFSIYTDDEVWEALRRAHLTFVAELTEGLQYECGEGGEALSVGQGQLICLARALLRKSKILVLDEATAAVDLKTDDLIQATIRTEFKDCTVLTIAHRLNTIMDYDRVMVLDGGTVREFASPSTLLSQKESMFYAMAKDAGLVSSYHGNEKSM